MSDDVSVGDLFKVLPERADAVKKAMSRFQLERGIKASPRA